MTARSGERRGVIGFLTAPALYFVGLTALCSAYIQGPVTKLADFDSAVAEMTHFGLTPAPLIAALVILFELSMSFLVLSGSYRWAGAAALAGFTLFATFIALRFWEVPPGVERTMSTNGFFEHLGLAGAFGLVAWNDLQRRCTTMTDKS
ncbi:DoxX family protein [Rhizobium leguminosarum]|uniref:DoxX family protein n=1 Tax=Rhizobium leguminosarum TaxID=384 RepID=UPI003D7C15B0